MAKNEVRIIGGKWRGRKLKFPDAKGLRPSQDRARETLFNWIAPWIIDARVLDLYAGSGVLGFEALSRGAASAELVDAAKPVARALEASKALLDANAASIFHRDALEHLRTRPAEGQNHSPGPIYDLVFVDPPFVRRSAHSAGASPPPQELENSQDTLITSTLRALLTNGLLAEDGLIYVEQPKREPLPQGFSVFRDKAFGDSRALLLEPPS